MELKFVIVDIVVGLFYFICKEIWNYDFKIIYVVIIFLVFFCKELKYKLVGV